MEASSFNVLCLKILFLLASVQSWQQFRPLLARANFFLPQYFLCSNIVSLNDLVPLYSLTLQILGLERMEIVKAKSLSVFLAESPCHPIFYLETLLSCFISIQEGWFFWLLELRNFFFSIYMFSCMPSQKFLYIPSSIMISVLTGSHWCIFFNFIDLKKISPYQ